MNASASCDEVAHICSEWRARFPSVEHLTAAQLMAMPQPLTLLDVRSPAEYTTSTLPGAVSVHDLKALPVDAPVVCFCTVGLRSSIHAQLLSHRLGPAAEVYSMEGVLAWAHAGGQFIKPATGVATEWVHVFSKRFARLLPNETLSLHFDQPSAMARELIRLVALIGTLIGSATLSSFSLRRLLRRIAGRDRGRDRDRHAD